jgi:hypothetical protein
MTDHRLPVEPRDDVLDYLEARGELRLVAEYKSTLHDLAEMTAERDQGKEFAEWLNDECRTLKARATRAEDALRVAREALADIRDSWPQDAKDLAKTAIDTIDALIPKPEESPDVG